MNNNAMTTPEPRREYPLRCNNPEPHRPHTVGVATNATWRCPGNRAVLEWADDPCRRLQHITLGDVFSLNGKDVKLIGFRTETTAEVLVLSTNERIWIEGVRTGTHGFAI